MTGNLLLAARVLLGLGAAGCLSALILFFVDKVYALRKERRKRPEFGPQRGTGYAFEGETELMETEEK